MLALGKRKCVVGKECYKYQGAFVNVIETRIMVAIHSEEYSEMVKCCRGGKIISCLPF